MAEIICCSKRLSENVANIVARFKKCCLLGLPTPPNMQRVVQARKSVGTFLMGLTAGTGLRYQSNDLSRNKMSSMRKGSTTIASENILLNFENCGCSLGAERLVELGRSELCDGRGRGMSLLQTPALAAEA